MATLLAQDHFYSDFLSLHLTVKTNNKAMMMLDSILATRKMPGIRIYMLEDWS